MKKYSHVLTKEQEMQIIEVGSPENMPFLIIEDFEFTPTIEIVESSDQ